MAPKGRRGSTRVVQGTPAVGLSSTVVGTLTAAQEDEVEKQVQQRLRETFRSSTAEEKDIIISSEGLTMRQTLTRDLRLRAMQSASAPEFGMYYNEAIKSRFRKRGISTFDMLKTTAKTAPGMVVSDELMEAIVCTQHNLTFFVLCVCFVFF